MRTLFNSVYGRAIKLNAMAEEAVPFLLSQKSIIGLSYQDLESLNKLPSMTRTPMYEIYTRMVREGLLDHFLFVDTTESPSVPTVLTVEDYSIYGKAVVNAPDELHSIWLNISNYITKRRSHVDPTTFKDVPRLMNLLVRGLLCLGYAERPIWLTPANSPFLVDVYSMVAVMRLRRSFHFSPDDEVLVRTAFAYHMAKVLGSEADAKTSEYPSLLNRCGFLGSGSEVMTQLDFLAAGTPDGQLYKNGLETVCNALQNVGSSRLRGKFSDKYFYRLFPIGSMETIVASAAIDYPPYWAYLLLSVASGGKIMLFGDMFKAPTYKRRLTEWVDRFVRARELMEYS